MMHSIKSGWGPTFALAKQNESEGRKSRIRLSKEERKAIAESFIKKYQESNSGNFPSLSLTHKEVGGSFYTVREIVRDIIQENRVLGPAKEERKAMVESFIKKYQESNSGNFPSLNLTHKEVGGNYYTVREILRDIIQENSVLGPAKFNLEEFNTDQFLEQNPLGSIAGGPQPFVAASSNENHSEHNKVTPANGKMLSVSDKHYTEAGHQVVDNEHVVNVGHVNVSNHEPIEVTIVSDGCYTGSVHPVIDNGHFVSGNQLDGVNNESVEAPVLSDGCHALAESVTFDRGPEHDINDMQVDMINKESNEATISEMQANKPTAPEQNVEQEVAATTVPGPKVNALTDELIVETFPLRSVAGTANGIKGLGELGDSSDSPEWDIKTLELEEGKKSELLGAEPTKKYNSLDDKLGDAFGNNKLNEISGIGLNKEKNLGDTLAESRNHSTHKEVSGTDPQVRASHQNAITSEISNQSQIRNGAKTTIQDGFPAKNLSKAYTEGSKPSDSGLHDAEKHRVDRQLGGNSQRISNATVDRINLESWDGRSKNSTKQESNPLVALFKAVANAFVKFWSE